MNRLCVIPGGAGQPPKPRKHEQRLLRNVGVHTVVLDLLQVPYDVKEDVRMNKLMALAHEFLQNFCLGNQQNQVLLHKQLDLFLNPGVCILFLHNKAFRVTAKNERLDHRKPLFKKWETQLLLDMHMHEHWQSSKVVCSQKNLKTLNILI